jgi:hypothetical protein
MLLAWSAVNRIGLSGTKVLGPQEKVTPAEAFRAITIDAAHALRKEDEIGSVDVGKKANFTVFDENPIKADPKTLKDLTIWGTVFEGEKYPIRKPALGLRMPQEDEARLAALADQNHATGHDHHHGCACTVNQILQAVARSQEE